MSDIWFQNLMVMRIIKPEEKVLYLGSNEKEHSG